MTFARTPTPPPTNPSSLFPFFDCYNQTYINNHTDMGMGLAMMRQVSSSVMEPAQDTKMDVDLEINVDVDVDVDMTDMDAGMDHPVQVGDGQDEDIEMGTEMEGDVQVRGLAPPLSAAETEKGATQEMEKVVTATEAREKERNSSSSMASYQEPSQSSNPSSSFTTLTKVKTHSPPFTSTPIMSPSFTSPLFSSSSKESTSMLPSKDPSKLKTFPSDVSASPTSVFPSPSTEILSTTISTSTSSVLATTPTPTNSKSSSPRLPISLSKSMYASPPSTSSITSAPASASTSTTTTYSHSYSLSHSLSHSHPPSKRSSKHKAKGKLVRSPTPGILQRPLVSHSNMYSDSSDTSGLVCVFEGENESPNNYNSYQAVSANVSDSREGKQSTCAKEIKEVEDRKEFRERVKMVQGTAKSLGLEPLDLKAFVPGWNDEDEDFLSGSNHLQKETGKQIDSGRSTLLSLNDDDFKHKGKDEYCHKNKGKGKEKKDQEDEKENMTPSLMTKLPNEIILQILHHTLILSPTLHNFLNLSKVCKNFRPLVLSLAFTRLSLCSPKRVHGFWKLFNDTEIVRGEDDGEWELMKSRDIETSRTRTEKERRKESGNRGEDLRFEMAQAISQKLRSLECFETFFPKENFKEEEEEENERRLRQMKPRIGGGGGGGSVSSSGLSLRTPNGTIRTLGEVLASAFTITPSASDPSTLRFTPKSPLDNSETFLYYLPSHSFHFDESSSSSSSIPSTSTIPNTPIRPGVVADIGEAAEGSQTVWTFYESSPSNVQIPHTFTFNNHPVTTGLSISLSTVSPSSPPPPPRRRSRKLELFPRLTRLDVTILKNEFVLPCLNYTNVKSLGLTSTHLSNLHPSLQEFVDSRLRSKIEELRLRNWTVKSSDFVGSIKSVTLLNCIAARMSSEEEKECKIERLHIGNFKYSRGQDDLLRWMSTNLQSLRWDLQLPIMTFKLFKSVLQSFRDAKCLQDVTIQIEKSRVEKMVADPTWTWEKILQDVPEMVRDLTLIGDEECVKGLVSFWKQDSESVQPHSVMDEESMERRQTWKRVKLLRMCVGGHGSRWREWVNEEGKRRGITTEWK